MGNEAADIKDTRLYKLCDNVKEKCTKENMSKILELKNCTSIEKKIWELVKPHSSKLEKFKKLLKRDKLKKNFNKCIGGIVHNCWAMVSKISDFKKRNEGNYTENLCKSKTAQLKANYSRMTGGYDEDNGYKTLADDNEATGGLSSDQFDGFTKEAWKTMCDNMFKAVDDKINEINSLCKES